LLGWRGLQAAAHIAGVEDREEKAICSKGLFIHSEKSTGPNSE